MAERNAPSAFDRAFAELNSALIDLDGDGIPDVQVPRNALAGGQVPQQYNNALFPSGGQLPNYGFGDPTQMSKMGMTPEAAGSISGPAPRPQEYTQPIAEMTPAPIPGLGALATGGRAIMRVATDPRVAGPVAAGAAFLGGMSGGSIGEESPVQQLRAQRELIVQQQTDAYKRRETQRADGEGPKFKRAEADYADLQNRLNDIDSKIEAYRNSPEGQLELKKEAARLAAAEADRLAHLPFGEAYPGLNSALPVARFGAAFALPAAIGAAGRIGTRLPMSTTGRIENALVRGRNALQPGTDPIVRQGAGNELAEYANREPGAISSGLNTVGKYIGAATLGGSAAAELTGLPEQYDAKLLKPGSPEQKAAAERAIDPSTYLWPFIFGAASGIGGKESSAIFGKRAPDYAGARGVSNALLSGQPTPPSAPPPRVVIQRTDKIGRDYFVEPGSGRVSNPNP